MPQVDGERLQFIYSLRPTRVVDGERARTVGNVRLRLRPSDLGAARRRLSLTADGSSLIHEVQWRRSAESNAIISTGSSGSTRRTICARVSRPFFLQKRHRIRCRVGLASGRKAAVGLLQRRRQRIVARFNRSDRHPCGARKRCHFVDRRPRPETTSINPRGSRCPVTTAVAWKKPAAASRNPRTRATECPGVNGRSFSKPFPISWIRLIPPENIATTPRPRCEHQAPSGER